MENTAVKYAPGMRIIVRGEEWMVKKVDTNSLGNQTLHVIGISQLVKDYDSMFLVDIENNIEIVNPAKVTLIPDDSAFFRKSKVYIESQWREKIPTDNKIHIGDKAAMDLMPYQLEPAQMALNKTRQRILIADTVGLGKTLEAGILMSELIARGKGKRILVVTVKSMMTQFQKEMWNRFTIPLVRLDSAKIQSVRAKLPSNYNPFFYYDKTIISIDTLKNDLDYRTHLEHAWWDIIVIDEAHNVAKRGDRSSQRSKLASLLANRSDTLIMLTATPHDGKGQSVASLMNMLDPTAIADEEHYTKDDIQGLLIRRFKKDIQDQVSGSFKERKITIERCSASAREEYAYDIFAEMQLQMDQSQANGKGILFKTSLEKSLFSSPVACIKSIEARIKKLEKKYTETEMPDITRLKELKSALEMITPSDFSRYTKLLELLRSIEYGWTPAKNNDRLVIFTERIETMKYLAENLKRDMKLADNQLEVMYGGMSDKELQRIVDEFGRAESPIRVIVASDVASEGINLHYLSHRLIHFDIPWSLMVFQQRNGRIDRYGQHEQPDIRYMLIDSENPKIKGDARIMEILVQKEEQALKNIGDPAMLFGKFNQEEEEEETAKAIENGVGEAFADQLDAGEEEFDPLELLMGLGEEDTVKIEYSDEETLFSDLDYVKNALDVFTDTEEIKYADLTATQGVEIKLTDNVKKKISKLMPPEAMPSDDYLRLSPDKVYCMKDMSRCMQNELAETAWPATQYLWKLHPIFNWIEDKAGVFYKRNEIPVLGLSNGLRANEIVYIIAGTIPNRKSTTVVDEWFGVYYKDNKFVQIFTMSEVMLLWAFLCVAQERGDDILQGKIFEKSDDEDESGKSVELINDDVLAKLFFAGDEAPRFIILFGINQIALIDRNKWNEKRYLQFMMEDIYSRHEESTFMAMVVLLHKESLCPADGTCVLDSLDENSHKHSAGVSDALKYALRECIEILGNEVIYDMKTRQGIDLSETPVDASELTLECLRYMYRFLFMLFIEARPELGYAPMKSQAYVQGYSLEGLRDVCDRVREASEVVSEGYYIDDTLKELFHMTYYGYPEKLEEYKKALEIEKTSMYDAFTIEALKAHIFDPEYTKMITQARLRNCAMIQIVDLMSISRPTNSKERRGRISYSALGINQMGAVYEALLSYRGFIAEETLFEVKRKGEKFNELDVGYFIPESELDNYEEEERVRYEKGERKGQLK